MLDWPHAPVHRLNEKGAYIITAGTYQKQRYFHNSERLFILQNYLLMIAAEYGWELQAWALLSNHYHFLAMSPSEPATLKTVISKLRTLTSREINRLDKAPGRKIWHQYWESRITYQKSYLARLSYVQNNAVHHGIVDKAVDYPFCSAAWFERTASAAFQKTLASFRADKIRIRDDF